MCLAPPLQVKLHLADFGINEDLAMGKIKRMSGGQKCRLVLAAAMWTKPHFIALDEPTNYLGAAQLADMFLVHATLQPSSNAPTKRPTSMRGGWGCSEPVAVASEPSFIPAQTTTHWQPLRRRSLLSRAV